MTSWESYPVELLCEYGLKTAFVLYPVWTSYSAVTVSVFVVMEVHANNGKSF
jgi:hypothetical protein